jgi:hypothetical protein
VAILYGLLEHVPDPQKILEETAGIVRPGGRVFVAVPDEEPYIRSGELSLLFHEHYSYFTQRTLRAALAAGGGSDIGIRRSSFANILVADGVVGPGSLPPVDPTDDVQLAEAFRPLAESATGAVWDVIEAARSAGKSVGIFVPGRAANMLVMGGGDVGGIRFFDDHPGLEGTYFPGIDVPVESRESLYRSPTSVLLIMSLSFGAKIRDSLRPRLSPSVEVRLLGDLLGAPNAA